MATKKCFSLLRRIKKKNRGQWCPDWGRTDKWEIILPHHRWNKKGVSFGKISAQKMFQY
jgi:hypothetical protein